MLYNRIEKGERGSKPDEICLARDVFGIDPENAFVNVKAKIIYDSKQGDIINQYIVFCRVFDEQIKLHGRTKKAVDETIRICKDRDVLKDYLAKEEVTDIMFGYFDYEKELEHLRQEERAEGRAEGEEKRSKEIYERLIAAKMPPEQARAIAFG